MEKTNNYEIFKNHDANRPIDATNLKKIIKSIQTKNLLSYRPILIDSQMRVIDGKHRLAAAKALGIEIYYDIQKDATNEDMYLLNDNVKQWSKEDYMNFYCQQGKEEYLKLKNFMQNNNISLANCLIVFGQSKGEKSKGESYPHLFKQGKYVFPKSAETIEAIKIFQKTEEIIAFVHGKIEGSKLFLMGGRIRRALYLFLSIKHVDFELFMQKLQQRLDLFRNCVTIKLYIHMFKSIYNYRNRNPLFLETDKFYVNESDDQGTV